MANVEEKLDLLISEVKSLQIGQLTLTTTVNAWSDGAERFSAGLNKEIESLTSRIKALEACHTRLSEENQVHTYMHARIKFHAYSDI
jgi:exonuclease VII small subunit